MSAGAKDTETDERQMSKLISEAKLRADKQGDSLILWPQAADTSGGKYLQFFFFYMETTLEAVEGTVLRQMCKTL